MKLMLLIILEFAGLLFILNVLKLILFHHFPNKIKFYFKKKKLPPFVKRKIQKIIAKHKFKYIGVRKEKIFLIFSIKYYLYKNDKNIYLDVSNDKFYYFSYKKDGIIHMLFTKNQLKDYNKEKINIELFQNLEFEDAEDIEREEISKIFYENVKLLPLFTRFFSYGIFIFFIIQLIYLLIIF